MKKPIREDDGLLTKPTIYMAMGSIIIAIGIFVFLCFN